MPTSTRQVSLQAPENNEPMTFGRRLETALHKRKMSRTALAAAVGINRVSISQVISGDSKAMSAENCARAARALQVNHFWLATGEGEMTDPSPTQGPPNIETVLRTLAQHLAATPRDRLPSIGKLLEGMAQAGGATEAYLAGLLALVGATPAPSWESIARDRLVDIKDARLRDDIALYLSAVDDAHAVAVAQHRDGVATSVER